MVENDVVKDVIKRIQVLCTSEQLEEFIVELEKQKEVAKSVRALAQFVYGYESNLLFSKGPISVPGSPRSKKSTLIATDLETDATGFKSPIAYPIRLEGLQQRVNGEDHNQSRYYETASSSTEAEKALAKSPKNVSGWIDYAVSGLPALNYASLDAHSSNVHKSLNALSQALHSNRFSSPLWHFYLELYVRRGKQDDIRRLFRQAIGFLPNDMDLWWRFYCWEKVFSSKKEILHDMLKELVKGISL